MSYYIIFIGLFLNTFQSVEIDSWKEMISKKCLTLFIFLSKIVKPYPISFYLVSTTLLFLI